ncbi:MAG: hypothetical protein JOZ15_02535 [Acidobacteria bacterium]|nr:hypothetical protein [Acidobacteriota bacterium]
MQIAFLSLFLVLVSGPLPVSLSAGPKVAAVELVLDGASVTRLEGPPWKGNVDFGPGLLPHHLVARALDGGGGELASAEQWINLPRPAAEVEIVPEITAPGEPRAVRLTWQSRTNERPAEVTLTLDGKPLKLDAHNRATLPLRPPNSPTGVLSAEVRFPRGLAARQDVALGRDFGDAVATELTGIPVWLRPGRTLPPVAGMKGWLADGGQPLRVAAADAGQAQLLVVRDPLAPRQLGGIYAFRVSLRHSAQLRFVSTMGHLFTGPDISSELFESSEPFAVAGEGDVAHAVMKLINHVERPGAPQHLADAVAVAGLEAFATGRPRAVLVVLAPNGKDISRFDAAAVRRYLAALHVSLFVWSVGTPEPAAAAAWGNVVDCSSTSEVDRSFEALKESLESQRIVWVEGRHLPQAVTLSPAAAEVLTLGPAL